MKLSSAALFLLLLLSSYTATHDHSNDISNLSAATEKTFSIWVNFQVWSHVTPGEINRLSPLISISVRDIYCDHLSDVAHARKSGRRSGCWSAALCSLSPGDQTDTDRGYLRKVGQDGETDQLLMKVLFLFGFSWILRFSVWHCDRGGWRMLGCMQDGRRWAGGAEWITDGISGNHRDDRAVTGFRHSFTLVYNNLEQYTTH